MKRKTLNPVVSPEITSRVAKAVARDAGNRDRCDRDEYLAPPRGRRRHRATRRCRGNQAGQKKLLARKWKESRVWKGDLEWEPDRGQLARDEGWNSEEVG